MNLNIKTDGSGRQSVELEDGTPLQHVNGIQVDIKANRLTTARLTFALPNLQFRGCKGIVSREHLAELAQAHGYKLEPILDRPQLELFR